MTEHYQSDQGVLYREIGRRSFLKGAATAIGCVLVLRETAFGAEKPVQAAEVIVDKKGMYGVRFSQHGKRYIAAGKRQHIKGEVAGLAAHINGSLKEGEKKVTLGGLLDGDPSNHELVAIIADERDVFEPKTLSAYVTPARERKYASSEGLSRVLLESEVEDMNHDAAIGTKLEEMYSRKEDRVQRFVEALDRQSRGEFKWSTPFEGHMGFKSEDEMRCVLGKTVSVEIRYHPALPTNTTDFEVTYKLDDGKKVVKYVAEFALSASLLELKERKEMAKFQQELVLQKEKKEADKPKGEEKKE